MLNAGVLDGNMLDVKLLDVKVLDGKVLNMNANRRVLVIVLLFPYNCIIQKNTLNKYL